MKEKLKQWFDYLKPYHGIIYFLGALFASHFLWKFAVDANLKGQEIAIFGLDCTPQFYKISQFVAKTVYHFSCLFPGSETLKLKDTLLFFTDGKMAFRIIWGCTGIKQIYIFAVIMSLYPGPWKKKLWYIPLGCLILSIYNIVRITCIIFLAKDHPENFDFLHEGITRYIYYGLIFLLWLIWEEKIRKNSHQTAVK